MGADVFLDTNILIYACSAAPADAGKQRRAAGLVTGSRFGLSAQVLQEFVANALRKKSLGITESGIDALLELSGHVPVLPVTRELVLASVTLRRRFQLSHWDATILAAARELRCGVLYSENFSHGQRFDDLQVINPFR